LPIAISPNQFRDTRQMFREIRYKIHAERKGRDLICKVGTITIIYERLSLMELMRNKSSIDKNEK